MLRDIWWVSAAQKDKGLFYTKYWKMCILGRFRTRTKGKYYHQATGHGISYLKDKKEEKVIFGCIGSDVDAERQ